MSDPIMQWYEEQRQKAEEVREKIAALKATKDYSKKELMKLEAQLEVAEYVGD
jgi:hypothetical protein